MFGASILFAGAISSAALPARAARDIQSNYPTWAVREGKSAAATLELVVEPDGKVRGCRVLAFVGDERLAQEECRITGRAKLTPAIGPDGNPILSRYKTFTSLWVEGSGQRMVVQRARPAPDMILGVNALPEGFDEQKDLELDLLIDSDGKVKHCEGGKNFEEASQAALVQVACQQAADLTVTPLMDASGAATDHVANLTVRLEVAPRP